MIDHADFDYMFKLRIIGFTFSGPETEKKLTTLPLPPKKKKLNWMFPQLVEEFKYYIYGAYKKKTSSAWKLSVLFELSSALIIIYRHAHCMHIYIFKLYIIWCKIKIR